MRAGDFASAVGSTFYTGVPDSQLRALCDWLEEEYGGDRAHHVVAANEGNAVAVAAGHWLATGEVPVVYMQNSGEGNAVNPVASLLSDRVYAIPVVFVVGWRGEPGVKDEPQHAFQGEVTLELLDCLEVEHFVVGPDTAPEEVRAAMGSFSAALGRGRSVAFVIRKGALEHPGGAARRSGWAMAREEALRLVALAAGDDPVVCTTGKPSRELFELREALGQGHGRDFLTVGSMGHASSIALGVALARPEVRVWCVDGDGAALMHMGAMAAIGEASPANLVHVVLNNRAHESVGGMPTAAGGLDFQALAGACGYRRAWAAEDPSGLERALARAAAAEGPVLVEARCSIGSRPDLGRPTTTPVQNRDAFMAHLRRG